MSSIITIGSPYRTHRERKELYIKSLEDEVLRLRETYSRLSLHNESIMVENKHLKDLLAVHAIAIPSSFRSDPTEPQAQEGRCDIATSSSATDDGDTGYYMRTSTPPLTIPSVASSLSPPSRDHLLPWPDAAYISGSRHDPAMNWPIIDGLDYHQAGIDFVLTLEKPCMSHLPWLLERGTEDDGKPCGHALMASCPPLPFGQLYDGVPFGAWEGPGDMITAHTTWRPAHADLSTLLDLSKRLDLNGELTPVMSWSMVSSHPRFIDLKRKDFIKLATELKDKVRCYGFGAVLEEFEVRDALENMFSSRLDQYNFLLLRYRVRHFARIQ
jgi:hypothetical protein